MAIAIVPVNNDNLSLVAQAGSKFGMPRSERWFRKCLFDPTVEDLVHDDCRGHMAVKDGNEVVAIQCYYYIPIYFRQKKMLMTTGCIMGADKKYGEWLLCCLDENRKCQNKGAIGVGNCIANRRSARICAVYHKLKEAPAQARQLRRGIPSCPLYLIHALRKFCHLPTGLLKIAWWTVYPIVAFCNLCKTLLSVMNGYRIVQYDKIDTQKFEEFWQRYLSENNGVVTSRDPQRLSWLFDDSLAAKMVRIVAAEKDGKIQGYALLRRYPREDGFFNNHSLYDICAVGNDKKCLKVLMRGALSSSAKDYGLLMRYVGALPEQDIWLAPFMRWWTQLDHSTIFYGSRNVEIINSVERGEGWFLGPMDGERCMGCGRYIDL